MVLWVRSLVSIQGIAAISRAFFIERTIFGGIVKRYRPFYDPCDNGPDAAAAARLYRDPDRPPAEESPNSVGLRNAPSRQDYNLPVDQLRISQSDQSC